MHGVFYGDPGSQDMLPSLREAQPLPRQRTPAWRLSLQSESSNKLFLSTGVEVDASQTSFYTYSPSQRLRADMLRGTTRRGLTPALLGFLRWICKVGLVAFQCPALVLSLPWTHSCHTSDLIPSMGSHVPGSPWFSRSPSSLLACPSPRWSIQGFPLHRVGRQVSPVVQRQLLKMLHRYVTV